MRITFLRTNIRKPSLSQIFTCFISLTLVYYIKSNYRTQYIDKTFVKNEKKILIYVKYSISQNSIAV